MVHRNSTVEAKGEGYITAGQPWTSIWRMKQLWDFLQKKEKISCLGQIEEVRAVPDRASLQKSLSETVLCGYDSFC